MVTTIDNTISNRKNNTDYIEKRRTIRIRRSGLMHQKLEDIEKPSLKFAETKEELEQTFRLVYDVYSKKGFVPCVKENGMLYNIYSLLPDTTHVIAKSYQNVISNLTMMFDHKVFGLPMDELYKGELDDLRSNGRKIVELSALATPREHRWKNIFHYLVQVVYWYALYSDVDDICISINPRHVRYYMYLFPFEKFGSERYYPRVDAPAIGLRAKVQEIIGRMRQICNELGFDTPLYDYFYQMTGYKPARELPYMARNKLQIVVQPNKLDTQSVEYFIQLDPEIVSDLNTDQMEKLLEIYPGLQLPGF